MNSVQYSSTQHCYLGYLWKGGRANKMFDKCIHEKILNLLLERRGGISFDRADKTALYVRMLGDVIVHGKLVTTDPFPIRRGSVPENEYKAPEIVPCSKIRRTSLQTPTVAAIDPTPPVSSALQAKQTNDEDGQSKVTRQNQRIPSAVLMDAAYHGHTQDMLKSIGQWDFNIFNFDDVSKGRSLRLVLSHLFQEYGLTSHFKLDSYKLLKTFEMIEEAYYTKSKNPYHNSMHAADVCQAMHCYLQEDKLREALTPIEVMGALLASAMHDLDHPGVNMKFLVNSKHHLADLYQNLSILENHHWRVGISVLKETGVLDHLPPDQWKMFVDHIRSLILATDIARQQEFLQEFQKQLNRKDINLTDYERRKFILQIGLKCADICNPCRPWQITEKWGNLVSEEFFRQGDREKLHNIPVSMNCDRHKTTIPQIQCGFIGFVVEPLFNHWSHFLPTKLSRSMLHNMGENRTAWTARLEAEKQKEAELQAAVTAGQTSAIQSVSSEKVDIVASKPADAVCRPVNNVCKSQDSVCKPQKGACTPVDVACKPMDVVCKSVAVPQAKGAKDSGKGAKDSGKGTENPGKGHEAEEPESKTLKLSVNDKRRGDISAGSVNSIHQADADRHKPSAITHPHGVAGRLHGHSELDRPLSAVLSPKTQQHVHAVHRTIDVTLSDSNAISSHSQSADNLRSSGSVSSMLPIRTASDAAKKRDVMPPNASKRGKGGSENMLHTGFVGSRRLDSFSLRLPRSPCTNRKNVSYDDPWEKNTDSSLRSPPVDIGSPVGSPRLNSPLTSPIGSPHFTSPLGSPQCIESSLLHSAKHHLKYSHTSPGLSDPHNDRKDSHFRPGLNNNLDFAIPVDLKSGPSLLHHNMSHNKQHDNTEMPHWAERGLHMYSEQNSVLQRNSRHFMKAALSPSSRELAGGLDQRTKATPASLLVRHGDGIGGSLREGRSTFSPPSSRHATSEGSSLLVPNNDSSAKDGMRGKGSPFIRKRMEERDRRKGQDNNPLLRSGSLSPRITPRGTNNAYTPSPASPPTCHTPTSPPPYSVPPALGPLFQDFTSSQIASIAHHKQHLKEAEPPAAPLGLGGSFLADSSPRLVRHRDAREGGSTTHRQRQDGGNPAR